MQTEREKKCPTGAAVGNSVRYNSAVEGSVNVVELLSDISGIEAIAVGSRIRELPRLKREYGPGRWRKMKGVARVRLSDNSVRLAEVHWYEAHGIGRYEFKAKKLID
jgi:hypothetical protein